MRAILLTGPPGIGKTTVVERVRSHFSSQGFKIGGFSSSEVREGGQRKGFKITDLTTGKEGWLSRKDAGAGPRVGLYRVIAEDLEEFGVASLERAIEDPVDLILIDEIGPMEMTSITFRRTVTKVLSAGKPVMATVRLGSHYPEVDRVREDCVQFEITLDTRDSIYRKLLEQLRNWLSLPESKKS